MVCCHLPIVLVKPDTDDTKRDRDDIRPIPSAFRTGVQNEHQDDLRRHRSPGYLASKSNCEEEKMNKHASNVQTMPRSPSLTASVATQFLALVLVFFAVGTAAYVQLVNIGVIYSW
jgi:hypothetical protein